MDRFTNIFNLPDPLFRALTYDDYDGYGDVTVTGMIKPPRIVQLFKRHRQEIVRDASEMVWSLLGQAVHVILERSCKKGDVRFIAEERLNKSLAGWVYSGKTDIYELKNEGLVNETATLSDYKVCSVFAFMLGSKREWGAQVNLNADLYRHAGFRVDQTQIVAILRDWVKTKSIIDSSYPQCGVHIVGQPLWTPKECNDYATERIELHKRASTLPDQDLPLCTEEERWYRGGGWAVMKEGNKRAVAVLDNQVDANERARQENFKENELFTDTGKKKKGKPRKIVVERREGQNIRCLHYCEARSVCSFGLALKAGLVNENLEEKEFVNEDTK